MTKQTPWKTSEYPRLEFPVSENRSVFYWGERYKHFQDNGIKVDPALLPDKINCGQSARRKILSLCEVSRRQMDSGYLRAKYGYWGEHNQPTYDERGHVHQFMTTGLPSLLHGAGGGLLCELLKAAPADISMLDEAWFVYFWIPIVEFACIEKNGHTTHAEALLNRLEGDLFWGDPNESLVEGIYANLAKFFTSAWLRQLGFDHAGSFILEEVESVSCSTTAFRDVTIPRCLDLVRFIGLPVVFDIKFLQILVPGQLHSHKYVKTRSKANILLRELFSYNLKDKEAWHRLDEILHIIKNDDDRRFSRVFKDDPWIKSVTKDVTDSTPESDSLHILEYRANAEVDKMDSLVRLNPRLRYVVDEKSV